MSCVIVKCDVYDVSCRANNFNFDDICHSFQSYKWPHLK